MLNAPDFAIPVTTGIILGFIMKVLVNCHDIFGASYFVKKPTSKT